MGSRSFPVHYPDIWDDMPYFLMIFFFQNLVHNKATSWNGTKHYINQTWIAAPARILVRGSKPAVIAWRSARTLSTEWTIQFVEHLQWGKPRQYTFDFFSFFSFFFFFFLRRTNLFISLQDEEVTEQSLARLTDAKLECIQNRQYWLSKLVDMLLRDPNARITFIPEDVQIYIETCYVDPLRQARLICSCLGI